MSYICKGSAGCQSHQYRRPSPHYLYYLPKAWAVGIPKLFFHIFQLPNYFLAGRQKKWEGKSSCFKNLEWTSKKLQCTLDITCKLSLFIWMERENGTFCIWLSTNNCALSYSDTLWLRVIFQFKKKLLPELWSWANQASFLFMKCSQKATRELLWNFLTYWSGELIPVVWLVK